MFLSIIRQKQNFFPPLSRSSPSSALRPVTLVLKFQIARCYKRSLDAIEKIPRAEVEKELTALGLPVEAVDTILRALTLRSIDDLEELLGSDNEAVVDLKQLFELARGYGFEDWLQFDASVVRGLSHITQEQSLRPLTGQGLYVQFVEGAEMTSVCLHLGE
ncbi:hypothetical protein Mp_6g04930 [Marchantia polymorpha subsp. ruderalis]|uniref:histidine--tRNA ligase n=2 Tax=Marchantia polymorpha TaxID=3197 RepID=A0AAF6BNM0_MARPO|nr:hypothetical protein MARPO_0034s0025 [Marchantia polymorpha]BBN13604.1 hypothetical protein Mp_6g04930 [Marchantia polymorpha subsp. ruderalis]|eukprot:PTQ41426.1 hypothetical protein MARPO_0034s0025 [Marchantia polymorpha]